MDEVTTTTSKSRRWFVVTVRALLLAVLAIGCWFGWIAHKVRIQRDAVAKIRQMRGQVNYDWQYGNRKAGPHPLPPGWPKWLVKALGPDFFGYVAAVSVQDRSNNVDELMEHVAKLDHLEHLELYQSGATDAGVGKLSRLTSLKHLSLHTTAVTAKSLVHLKGMTLLEDLRFDSTGITDDDLANLAGMIKLKKLMLPNANISDVGLAHLKNLNSLTFVDLSNTRITTIEPLRNSTGLVYLGLSGCPIDDAGLAPVAGMPNLNALILFRTRVTQRGLVHIQDLKKLKLVTLPVSVSESEFQSLKVRHPTTKFM